MKKKNTVLMDSVIIFTVVFVVGMVVEFLYSLIVYRSSLIEAETSFRLALTLAASLVIIQRLKKK